QLSPAKAFRRTGKPPLYRAKTQTDRTKETSEPSRDRPESHIRCASEPGEDMNTNTESKTAPKLINGRINGRFAKGFSGNPGGSPEATRRAFNKRFLLDLAEDWQQHGREVFKRVRRESPAAYLKVCAMLVPKEMKVEHGSRVKA